MDAAASNKKFALKAIGSAYERPQADDIRRPPPVGVRNTWGGPAFVSCERIGQSIGLVGTGRTNWGVRKPARFTSYGSSTTANVDDEHADNHKHTAEHF